MTEEKTKSLEERAKALRSATNKIYNFISGKSEVYDQEYISTIKSINLVCAQNDLIIDYLQEIYKEIKK